MITAPLFRDPIYDGAADPTVIFNRTTKTWFMFYTNRRAVPPFIGYSWIHGTDIGIAESTDGGASWLYRGIAEGLNYEPGRNTYWAPEIVYHEGVYHMYVSYVRGIPLTWDYDRYILHYTSTDLWHWSFEARVMLSSDRVIDACVVEKPEGGFRMWYKDECAGSHTFAADSADLYTWEVVGKVISDAPHEGVNVFRFGGKNWLITDEWHGMGVYSSDTLDNWQKQDTLILDKAGKRPDDAAIGNHADVEVMGERAYIFYFTHPDGHPEDENLPEGANPYRTSVQAAELTVVDGKLVCDRDADTYVRLEA